MTAHVALGAVLSGSMSSQGQVALIGSKKPEAPKKKAAPKKLETNFGDWLKWGPEKYEKSEWAVVSGLALDVPDLCHSTLPTSSGSRISSSSLSPT